MKKLNILSLKLKKKSSVVRESKNDDPTIIPVVEPKDSLNVKEIKKEVDQITEAIHHHGLTDESFRNPVYLILTSKNALIKKYGELNFDKIKVELETLINLTSKYNNWKAQLVFVDDMTSVNQFGLAAVDENDAWAIKTLIADIDASLAEKKPNDQLFVDRWWTFDHSFPLFAKSCT